MLLPPPAPAPAVHAAPLLPSLKWPRPPLPPVQVRKCWAEDPAARPTFSEIIAHLRWGLPWVVKAAPWAGEPALWACCRDLILMAAPSASGRIVVGDGLGALQPSMRPAQTPFPNSPRLFLLPPSGTCWAWPSSRMPSGPRRRPVTPAGPGSPRQRRPSRWRGPPRPRRSRARRRRCRRPPPPSLRRCPPGSTLLRQSQSRRRRCRRAGAGRRRSSGTRPAALCGASSPPEHPRASCWATGRHLAMCACLLPSGSGLAPSPLIWPAPMWLQAAYSKDGCMQLGCGLCARRAPRALCTHRFPRFLFALC